MRSRRRTPAGGVQAEKQRRYAQLIAQGVNNSEACRLVGIDRKTGNRWRYGRKVRNSAGALVIYPPVKIKQARPRSPRYLSEHERIRIADLLAAGVIDSEGIEGLKEETRDEVRAAADALCTQAPSATASSSLRCGSPGSRTG